ncbi:MAG TPA: hypothetical protein VNE62_06725 [Actinomycetota bacterium]|nr:hypothetical protein [Actinomycetota bacterium]
MRLICANHSAYPRVGETPESQRLRRAYARRETGDVSTEGYVETARDYAAEVIAEQAEAGCDLVTDGQVHWYDLISHPASRLDGVGINGLLRFFDTNTYIRQPEILGPLSGRFDLTADYTWATTVSSRPVKPVLTGPYTLARYSIVRTDHYSDVAALTMALAELVGDELHELGRAGATLAQIDEPELLRHPEDAALVNKALQVATDRKGPLRVSLATYFGDATDLYRTLLDMPVDMLALDLQYGPGLVAEIERQGSDRPLALGAVDGRNTALDGTSVAGIVDRVAEALDSRGVEELHLQPSCSLEYLPRDRARRKLVRMREIAESVTKVGA